MLIDRYLPAFDETYIYEASVNASPDATYAAIRETNLVLIRWMLLPRLRREAERRAAIKQ